MSEQDNITKNTIVWIPNGRAMYQILQRSNTTQHPNPGLPALSFHNRRSTKFERSTFDPVTDTQWEYTGHHPCYDHDHRQKAHRRLVFNCAQGRYTANTTMERTWADCGRALTLRRHEFARGSACHDLQRIRATWYAHAQA